MTGRMLDEGLGKWNFWIMFVGFNLAFFPMHISGLLGMPRRVYTYPQGMGWDTLNLITTIGAYLFALGVALFVVNVVKSYRRGQPAGNNPWDAPTLEWATTSPPPPYNFVVIPTIGSRLPLWEDRLTEGGESTPHSGLALTHGRETIGTTPLDASPDIILKMPEETYVPLLLGLAMTAIFAGLVTHAWWVVVLAVIVTAILILAWVRPRAELGETAEVPGG
jgi:hypothetical protein